MSFLDKIGKPKKILQILRENGWEGKDSVFYMQKHRGRFVTDVALILWEYCQKNGIPVTRQDFFKEGGS